MKQSENKPITYIGLMNRFWRLDDKLQFSSAATRLYFFLLDHANKLHWQDAFYYSDFRLRGNVGIASAETFRKARKELKEAGLIDFRAGGRGKGVRSFYTVTDANIQQILSKKTVREIAEEVNEHRQETAAPAREAEITVQEQPESNQIAESNPVEKPRNKDGLNRFLKEIYAQKDDAELIKRLSNFGEIGHPVWKLIAEVRNSNGQIKRPAKFIISRLTA